MAGLVTKETDLSVDDLINSIEDESKKEDAKILLKMMGEITGEKPKIWGDNFLIGFGKYSYTRKGSKEVFEWFPLGFAARKTKITVYIGLDVSKYSDILSRLGKCKWGKGCLYINKLADVDINALRELIVAAHTKSAH